MKKSRKKTPAWLTAAIAYHSQRKDESRMGCDWDEAHHLCWRCGHHRSLQQCHIVPASLGGSDNPDNMVGLCCECHDEMPNVKDPDAVWQWIAATCVPMHDTFWHIRSWELVKQLLPDAEKAVQVAQNTETVMSEYRKLQSEWSLHFRQNSSGGGIMSIGTRAWLMVQCCKKVLGTSPS